MVTLVSKGCQRVGTLASKGKTNSWLQNNPAPRGVPPARSDLFMKVPAICPATSLASLLGSNRDLYHCVLFGSSWLSIVGLVPATPSRSLVFSEAACAIWK